MGGLPEKSLLDAGILPVGEIAHIARREGVRPRAAYQTHKWFARRLAATARSLAVAAATPADSNFWSAFYGETTCTGVTVLDPFMGGGVMLLEASRLGADVYGTDVEPVAAAVSDFQGRLKDITGLEEALDKLTETVGAQMARFYETRDDEGVEERLLHAFWVQEHVCSNCWHLYDAHPNFRLAWNDPTNQEWVICEACGDITERAGKDVTHHCGCGRKTEPAAGRMDRGTAICPCCGQRDRLIDASDVTGHPPRFRLFAVETIPAGTEVRYPNAKRRLRKANPHDHAAFDAAATQLDQELAQDPDFIAIGPIPSVGRSDNRLLQYGYRDYADLFGARQKLHLGLLGRAISQVDGPTGEALKIAFSDHLTTNNMMCGYAGGWRRLAGLFSIRAYRHIVRPVELNPWLTKNGRGTFPNAVRSVRRAVEAIKQSVEPTVEGGSREVRWVEPGAWDIRCVDARNLAHIPEASVDLVLTDPPYFNYISYSELGHFFAPWLVRFGMIPPDHLRSFPEGQLAQPGGGAEAAAAFGKALGEALVEVARVSKPGARMVFTYQNLDGRGWQALAAGLAAAGIRPHRVWPMYGDSSGGLHKRANSISWDCVVLCKFEAPIDDLQPLVQFQDEGMVEADMWATRLKEAGHSLAAGDIRNLTHASAMLASFRAADRACPANEPKLDVGERV